MRCKQNIGVRFESAYLVDILDLIKILNTYRWTAPTCAHTNTASVSLLLGAMLVGVRLRIMTSLD